MEGILLGFVIQPGWLPLGRKVIRVSGETGTRVRDIIGPLYSQTQRPLWPPAHLRGWFHQPLALTEEPHRQLMASGGGGVRFHLGCGSSQVSHPQMDGPTPRSIWEAKLGTDGSFFKRRETGSEGVGSIWSKYFVWISQEILKRKRTDSWHACQHSLKMANGQHSSLCVLQALGAFTEFLSLLNVTITILNFNPTHPPTRIPFCRTSGSVHLGGVVSDRSFTFLIHCSEAS